MRKEDNGAFQLALFFRFFPPERCPLPARHSTSCTTITASSCCWQRQITRPTAADYHDRAQWIQWSLDCWRTDGFPLGHLLRVLHSLNIEHSTLKTKHQVSQSDMRGDTNHCKWRVISIHSFPLNIIKKKGKLDMDMITIIEVLFLFWASFYYFGTIEKFESLPYILQVNMSFIRIIVVIIRWDQLTQSSRIDRKI